VPLAIERTLLAWIRTGLALMAFGFVVARVGVFLEKLSADNPVWVDPASAIAGGLFVLLGGVVNIAAGLLHRPQESTVALPGTLKLAVWLAILTGVLGILLGGYTWF
jgi:putative membrane protein